MEHNGGEATLKAFLKGNKALFSRIMTDTPFSGCATWAVYSCEGPPIQSSSSTKNQVERSTTTTRTSQTFVSVGPVLISPPTGSKK